MVDPIQRSAWSEATTGSGPSRSGSWWPERPKARKPSPADPLWRYRLGLRRRGLLRRGVALLVALSAVASTVIERNGQPSMTDVGDGPTVQVPIATRDLEIGRVITSDDVRIETVPAAIASLGDIGEAGSLIGLTVAASLFEGEIVTAARLGTDNRLGLLVDERAVAIARPLAGLPLRAGDIVELLAVSIGFSGEVLTEPVGTSARVVAVDDDSVTVAVPAAIVPLVLERQAMGSIELSLTPWGG